MLALSRTIPISAGVGGLAASRTRIDASSVSYETASSTFAATLINPTMDTRLTLNVFLLQDSTVRVKVFEHTYEGVDWRCAALEGKPAPPACRRTAVHRQLADESAESGDDGDDGSSSTAGDPLEGEDSSTGAAEGKEAPPSTEEGAGLEEGTLDSEAQQAGWGIGELASSLPPIRRPLHERYDASEASIDDP